MKIGLCNLAQPRYEMRKLQRYNKKKTIAEILIKN